MKAPTALLTLALGLSACGDNHGTPTLIGSTDPASAVAPPAVESPPTVGATTPEGLVLKSRAIITLSTDDDDTVAATPELEGYASFASAVTTSGAKKVTVQNAVSTSFALDSSAWVKPPIRSTWLDFGALGVGALLDNNLKVCGDHGDTHCGHAYIRLYTTDARRAGFYNEADDYSAPITVALAGEREQTLGLESGEAVIVQGYEIPRDQNVLRETDFRAPPRYAIRADFSNAGAGHYTTRIVVEYLLGL
jgi:hypothetical protein